MTGIASVEQTTDNRTLLLQGAENETAPPPPLLPKKQRGWACAKKTLTAVRERLEAITREQKQLELERRRVLVEERDRWRADGIDAHVVGQCAGRRKLERKHLVSMFEILSDRSGEWVRDVSYRNIYVGDEPHPQWGPYASSSGGCIWLHRGTYVCVLADEDAVVIARAAKFYPASAAQVSRAGSRLRSLARREHMRVSIHDTAATVISPMNDVVHEGDITSAYLWLLGLDASSIEDRTKAYWDGLNLKQSAA